MRNQKNDENKREHSRQAPDRNILVYNSEILGQVLDISRGGMSFIYNYETARINDLFLDLNLMFKDRNVEVPALLCKTISDVELRDGSPEDDGRTRRCSVQFSTLTDAQRALLDDLLKDRENSTNA
ncbi:MAG: PilZ domain-containing protein [Desulfobulbaceae bacterium]|nr:PilZ domain-containing protein [Desulfobulbaceae bacterium]